MTTTITDVQQALINSQVSQQHWIDGGWTALSNQLEEELKKNKKEEILNVYYIVDQIEPELKILVGIQQLSFCYQIPISDVSALTDVNDIPHIHVQDLYSDWKDRITKKIEASKSIKTEVVTTYKGVWDKTKYMDEAGDTRVVYQRHS